MRRLIAAQAAALIGMECPEPTALRMSIWIDPDGQIKGIELYSERSYVAGIHYVFDMDQLVRYIKFRDLLAEKMRSTQG